MGFPDSFNISTSWFFNPFNSFIYYSTHFSEFGITVSFRMQLIDFSMLLVSFFLPTYICISYTINYIPYIFIHIHIIYICVSIYIYIHTNLIDFFLFSLICCVTHVPQNIASCVFPTRASIERLYPVGTLDQKLPFLVKFSTHLSIHTTLEPKVNL